MAHTQTAEDQPDSGRLKTPIFSVRTISYEPTHGGADRPENTAKNTPTIHIAVSTT
jgi:hypothetical protein